MCRAIGPELPDQTRNGQLASSIARFTAVGPISLKVANLLLRAEGTGPIPIVSNLAGSATQLGFLWQLVDVAGLDASHTRSHRPQLTESRRPPSAASAATGTSLMR